MPLTAAALQLFELGLVRGLSAMADVAVVKLWDAPHGSLIATLKKLELMSEWPPTEYVCFALPHHEVPVCHL